MGVRGSAVGRGLSPHTHLTQKIPHWSYMSIWMLVLGGREGGREGGKKEGRWGGGEKGEEEKKGKRGKERSSGGEKKRERRVYSMRYIVQSSILHAAVGHFPCTLLERPTVIPRVQFQWPIKVLVCTV